MNERWQYRLKTGGIWGVFMVVFTILFDLKEKPLTEQFSNSNFYLRSVIYIGIGIFVLGYFNWRAKNKE